MDNITEKIEIFIEENEKLFVGKMDIVVQYLLNMIITENEHVIRPKIVESLQAVKHYSSNFGDLDYQNLYQLELNNLLETISQNSIGYEILEEFVDALSNLNNKTKFVALQLEDILISFFNLSEYLDNTTDESYLDLIFIDLISNITCCEDEDEIPELDFDV